MLKIVENEAVKEEGYTLDALAREGARRMLMSALEEEVAAYVERHAEARALHEIMYAETRAQAERGIEAFVAEFSPKYEKAVDCLIKDSEALLAFFDFPAEHWKHLRTSNPIESSFATVRLRQRVTKGAGSRAKALTMAFKLLMLAKERWRKLNGAHLLPLVRARIPFVDGVRIERREDQANRKEAA